MFGSKVSEGGVNFYSICKELFDTLFDGLKSTIEKYFEGR